MGEAGHWRGIEVSNADGRIRQRNRFDLRPTGRILRGAKAGDLPVQQPDKSNSWLTPGRRGRSGFSLQGTLIAAA
jgi:hypothetical protein